MVITGVSAPFTKVVQEITLKTSDGIQTRIRYYDCEKDSLCFINLQNLPAFAISRNITHVRIPKNAKATFVSNPDPILLW